MSFWHIYLGIVGGGQAVTQRLRAQTCLFNGRPFQGEGHSLYVNTGDAVIYRRRRVMGGKWIKGANSTFQFTAESIPKTLAVASAALPTKDIVYSLPDSLASSDIVKDVRHYKDDVECEVDNIGTRKSSLDGLKDPVTEIKGAARIIEAQRRSSGSIRLRFAYSPTVDGVQPYLFRATRTAGPSSPTAVTTRYRDYLRIYEIDIAGLLDTSDYTFKITAENEAGSVTLDVITGWSFGVDASGPPKPQRVTAEGW